MFVWDGGLWEAVSGEGYGAEGGVLGGWSRSAPRGGSLGADQHQWGGWGRYSWVRTSTQGGSSVPEEVFTEMKEEPTFQEDV